MGVFQEHVFYFVNFLADNTKFALFDWNASILYQLYGFVLFLVFCLLLQSKVCEQYSPNCDIVFKIINGRLTECHNKIT